jgi:hypothetical protein
MDELDLISLFVNENFNNSLLDLFKDINQLKNREKIIIEVNTPEIGTKIGSFKENNNQINQIIKKDYYNNEYKNEIFYPFLTWIKVIKRQILNIILPIIMKMIFTIYIL